jgi:hypothetical protein
MKSLTSRIPKERPDSDEILKNVNKWKVTLEELRAKINDSYLEEDCDMTKQFTQYFIQRKLNLKQAKKVKKVFHAI